MCQPARQRLWENEDEYDILWDHEDDHADDCDDDDDEVGRRAPVAVVVVVVVVVVMIVVMAVVVVAVVVVDAAVVVAIEALCGRFSGSSSSNAARTSQAPLLLPWAATFRSIDPAFPV